jgi:aminoglycoside 3-N-acetyltransferase
VLGKQDIVNFIKENKLEDQVLSIHMAFRSLGEIEGGLDLLIDTFLAHNCTIMGPTHSWNFLLNTEKNSILFNNKFKSFSERAWNFKNNKKSSSEDIFDVYHTKADKGLGFFSSYLAQHPARKRSNNPLGSFCAVGPKAEEIVWGENHFYQPLRKLVELNGKVVLIGLDIYKMTLIHSIKEKAGSQMLMRWVKSGDNELSWVAGGGCSAGFKKLKPYLYKLASETTLGMATVKIINAKEVEQALLPVLQQEAANFPACDDSSCKLCQEALVDFRPSNEKEFYIFEREDILWSVAEKLQKSFFHLHEKYGNNQVLMAGKIIDLEGIPTKVFSPFEPRSGI